MKANFSLMIVSFESSTLDKEERLIDNVEWIHEFIEYSASI